MVVVVSRIISWFRFEMAVGYIYMRLIKASAAIAGNWIVLTLYTNVWFISAHTLLLKIGNGTGGGDGVCAWFVFWQRFNRISNPIQFPVSFCWLFSFFFSVRKGSPTARTKFVAFAVVFNILSTATAIRNRLQSHRMETVSIFESWICVYVFGCNMWHTISIMSFRMWNFSFHFIHSRVCVFSILSHLFKTTGKTNRIFYLSILFQTDMSPMLVHVQFWCTIAQRIVAIALYYRVQWLPVAIVTTYSMLHLPENRAAQIYCISRIWVRRDCSPSKRNCCARDWVRVRLSMLDRNQVASKLYCWARTMVRHYSCATKAKVTFICGTQRQHSNRRISSKCRRAAIVDCPHKFSPVTNDTCGQLKVISMISLRIKWDATVHR